MSDTNETTAVAAVVAPTSTETSTQTQAPWYGQADADTQKYIENKGWKAPGDLLKSYQNLERLRGVGADKLVKLPDPGNEEETAAFYTRLGVPETPDKYEPPAELDFELDTNILAGMSHKAKLTPAQHQTLTKEIASYLKSSQSEMLQATVEKDAADKVALEREWGPTKDENYQAATKAATRFGLDTEALDKLQKGLGYRGAIELLAKIGRSFGEAKAPAKDPAASAPFGTTPATAKERMDQLMTDKGFRDRYYSGDRTAQDMWNNLKRIAFSG